MGESLHRQKPVNKKNLEPRFSRWQLAAKRAVDFTAALVFSLVTLPLCLCLAVWIRLDSPGPAVFRQTRIGLNGKAYTIYKFRTMVRNAEKIFKPLPKENEKLEDFVFQDEDDHRITRAGRFLRKTSLDELPQFWNVLIGNMSLVGPRPEIPEIVQRYSPEQKKRLAVLPGITGLAQVSGRSELTLGETMAYDLEYVYNWNFGLDIWILCKTIQVVLAREGAV